MLHTISLAHIIDSCALTRIREMGNPNGHHTFKDESLNQVLREVVEHAHRTNEDERTFWFMRLLVRVGLNPDIF